MATIISIRTQGRSAANITDEIEAVIAASASHNGLAHLFLQHTSASLLIQENADPDVLRDIFDWLDKIAPESKSYRHSTEGADDMPAHLKAAMTATSLTIPFENGRLLLGTWQGVYVMEHRSTAHTRRLVVSLSASA